MLQFPLCLLHDLREGFLGSGFCLRGKNKPHATTRHATEHPETAKLLAKPLTNAVDDRLGVEVGGPGNDRLDRPKKVPRGGCSDPIHVARLDGGNDLVEHLASFAAGLPFRFTTKQVFLGHHFQDWAHVLGHAAVHEHERFLEIAAERHGLVAGKQSAAARAVLGIALGGRYAADQFCGGPHAPGILPAAAASAEPLAQDRPGRHQPPFRLRELANQRTRLPCGPHADGDQGGEEVGGDCQPRALRDVVDATDEFEAKARAHHALEEGGQAFP